MAVPKRDLVDRKDRLQISFAISTLQRVQAFPGRLGTSTVPSTRWHGLELRHLRALVAIADTSSFSEAASLLGYVQSTVSYNVTALESAVGTTLVRRRRGSSETSLTGAGEALATHSRRILAEISRAEAALGPLGQTQLVVGLSSDIARILLPHLHTRGGTVAARSVQAIEAPAADVRTMLLRGTCGIAIFEPPDDPRLASRVLAEDRFLFIQPVSRRARCGAVGETELAAAGMILHTAREGRLLRAFDQRGVSVNTVLRADTDQSVIDLVAAGLGSAIVPELAVRSSLDRVHARPLEAAIDVSPRVVAFGWERARRLRPDEIALMDDVAAALSSSISTLRAARSAA
jgi:DNA-binding transcriptional LysR family regulator